MNKRTAEKYVKQKKSK